MEPDGSGRKETSGCVVPFSKCSCSILRIGNHIRHSADLDSSCTTTTATTIDLHPHIIDQSYTGIEHSWSNNDFQCQQHCSQHVLRLHVERDGSGRNPNLHHQRRTSEQPDSNSHRRLPSRLLRCLDQIQWNLQGQHIPGQPRPDHPSGDEQVLCWSDRQSELPTNSTGLHPSPRICLQRKHNDTNIPRGDSGCWLSEISVSKRKRNILLSVANTGLDTARTLQRVTNGAGDFEEAARLSNLHRSADQRLHIAISG